MNEAEPCRTDPRWDLLSEPGQYGSVLLLTSITVLAVSKVTNVRRADMRSSQSLAEEYYECRTNNFFSKGTMDSALTDREVHCLIDIWTDEEIQSLLESANKTDLFSKESLARKGTSNKLQCNDIRDSINIIIRE